MDHGLLVRSLHGYRIASATPALVVDYGMEQVEIPLRDSCWKLHPCNLAPNLEIEELDRVRGRILFYVDP